MISSVVSPEALKRIEALIRAQPDLFTYKTGVLSYFPAVVMFATIFFAAFVWIIFRHQSKLVATKALATTYFCVGLAVLGWFGGCSSSGPESIFVTQPAPGPVGAFPQPASTFTQDVYLDVAVEFPVNSGMSISAAIFSDRNSCSYIGDDLFIPATAQPALDEEMTATIVESSGQKMLRVTAFKPGCALVLLGNQIAYKINIKDAASIASDVQKKIIDAVVNGSVQTDVQAVLESYKNSLPSNVAEKIEGKINPYSGFGQKVVDVRYRGSDGPPAVIYSLTSEQITQAKLDDLIGKNIPKTNVPLVQEIVPSAGPMGALVNVGDSTAGAPWNSEDSWKGALQASKYEVYDGFTPSRKRVHTLLRYATTTAGSVYALPQAQSNPESPYSSEQLPWFPDSSVPNNAIPRDALSPYLASLPNWENSNDETYGKAYVLNTGQWSNPHLRNLTGDAFLWRQPAPPAGSVADIMLSYFQQGVMNGLATGSVYFMGDVATETYTRTQVTGTPASKNEVKFTSSTSAGVVKQTNVYYSLMYFSDASVAYQQAQNFIDSFSSFATSLQVPAGAPKEFKEEDIRDKILGYYEGLYIDTDYLCQDEPSFQQIQMALVPSHSFTKYYRNFKTSSPVCVASNRPSKNAFPFMRYPSEEFIKVVPDKEGGAQLWFLMNSKIKWGSSSANELNVSPWIIYWLLRIKAETNTAHAFEPMHSMGLTLSVNKIKEEYGDAPVSLLPNVSNQPYDIPQYFSKLDKLIVSIHARGRSNPEPGIYVRSQSLPTVPSNLQNIAQMNDSQWEQNLWQVNEFLADLHSILDPNISDTKIGALSFSPVTTGAIDFEVVPQSYKYYDIVEDKIAAHSWHTQECTFEELNTNGQVYVPGGSSIFCGGGNGLIIPPAPYVSIKNCSMTSSVANPSQSVPVPKPNIPTSPCVIPPTQYLTVTGVIQTYSCTCVTAGGTEASCSVQKQVPPGMGGEISVLDLSYKNLCIWEDCGGEKKGLAGLYPDGRVKVGYWNGVPRTCGNLCGLATPVLTTATYPWKAYVGQATDDIYKFTNSTPGSEGDVWSLRKFQLIAGIRKAQTGAYSVSNTMALISYLGMFQSQVLRGLSIPPIQEANIFNSNVFVKPGRPFAPAASGGFTVDEDSSATYFWPWKVFDNSYFYTAARGYVPPNEFPPVNSNAYAFMGSSATWPWSHFYPWNYPYYYYSAYNGYYLPGGGLYYYWAERFQPWLHYHGWAGWDVSFQSNKDLAFKFDKGIPQRFSYDSQSNFVLEPGLDVRFKAELTFPGSFVIHDRPAHWSWDYFSDAYGNANGWWSYEELGYYVNSFKPEFGNWENLTGAKLCHQILGGTPETSFVSCGNGVILESPQRGVLEVGAQDYFHQQGTNYPKSISLPKGGGDWFEIGGTVSTVDRSMLASYDVYEKSSVHRENYMANQWKPYSPALVCPCPAEICSTPEEPDSPPPPVLWPPLQPPEPPVVIPTCENLPNGCFAWDGLAIPSCNGNDSAACAARGALCELNLNTGKGMCKCLGATNKIPTEPPPVQELSPGEVGSPVALSPTYPPNYYPPGGFIPGGFPDGWKSDPSLPPTEENKCKVPGDGLCHPGEIPVPVTPPGGLSGGGVGGGYGTTPGGPVGGGFKCCKPQPSKRDTPYPQLAPWQTPDGPGPIPGGPAYAPGKTGPDGKSCKDMGLSCSSDTECLVRDTKCSNGQCYCYNNKCRELPPSYMPAVCTFCAEAQAPNACGSGMHLVDIGGACCCNCDIPPGGGPVLCPQTNCFAACGPGGGP